MKRRLKKASKTAVLYERIREILAAGAVRCGTNGQHHAGRGELAIGREIVEEEQHGARRAEYGGRLLEELSKKLTQDFGVGYSVQGLRYMRQFYLEFPELVGTQPIRHTLRGKLPLLSVSASAAEIRQRPCGESHLSLKDWKPGQLHPNLSWSLYRHLLRVEKPAARSFYEIEAIQNNWSARELERQINSLLFERLALSRDKSGLLRMARKGQEIQGPLDVSRTRWSWSF